jgi:hypothetical protein
MTWTARSRLFASGGLIRRGVGVMLSAMGDQVFLLVIGFLLTSVAGGVLGLLFQERSWSHQHRAQQLDQQREQAIKVFEEVSSLLDRRLYRMRLVFWAAKRCAPAAPFAAGTTPDPVPTDTA